MEARDGAFGCGTAFQTGKSQVQLLMMTFEIFVDLIIRPHCGVAVDPQTNRNKSLGCLLGIKQNLRRADNLTNFINQLSRNSGRLSRLLSSGSARSVMV